MNVAPLRRQNIRVVRTEFLRNAAQNRLENNSKPRPTAWQVCQAVHGRKPRLSIWIFLRVLSRKCRKLTEKPASRFVGDGLQLLQWCFAAASFHNFHCRPSFASCRQRKLWKGVLQYVCRDGLRWVSLQSWSKSTVSDSLITFTC